MHFFSFQEINSLVIPEADVVASRFRNFCIAEIQRRFGSCEHVQRLASATLLDPRFLKIYFQSPLAVSKAMMYIEDEIKKLMRRDALEADAADEAVSGKHSVAL